MALGLAIGRIGCLLNGCCFGGQCHHAWAVTFPQGSPAYQDQVVRGQMYGFTLSKDPESDPIVLSVDPGSPAERADLNRGDVLKAGLLGDRFGIFKTEDAYWTIEQAFAHEKPLKMELADGRTIEIPPAPIPPRSLPVHPTQIYSSIDGLVLCLLLLAFAPFARRDGEVFALMISIYPITRFLIEGLRTDEAAVRGTGMSISQNVSIGLLLAAIALWVYIVRWSPKLTRGDG
jgi:phosphatidylglycerol:prolipoprotein diacylglycerol transferase